ncbi:MAG: chemotaxis protein CheW [Myxococcota bacterium]
MSFAQSDVSVKLLLFRKRDSVYALPLGDVLEIMRPLPLERIEGAPPFVLGLSMIRGESVPVLDLGVLLGADDNESSLRFIRLRVGTRCLALAVGEVLGIREVPRTHFAELPPLLTSTRAHLVEALGSLDSKSLQVLHSARVFAPPLLAAIPSHGEPA